MTLEVRLWGFTSVSILWISAQYVTHLSMTPCCEVWLHTVETLTQWVWGVGQQA